MTKSAFAAVALFFITLSIYSQSNIKLIDTVSIKNQFEYVLDNSKALQDHKIVRSAWLLKLKSNVLDSLSASKNKMLLNSDMLNSQKQLIDSINKRLLESETVISTLIAEKDSISFFGIQFEKSIFKNLVSLLIIGLIVGLLFFITKFKQSNSITTQSKLALKQTEEEFAIYKEKALEREQKAMRRLQDELNKNKKES